MTRQRSVHWRFIPTCVGNAGRPGRRRERLTVHPHVCGERRSPAAPYLQWSGSSPRVWGTQNIHPTNRDIPRFIPTCVGNAWQPCPRHTWPTVHPHVCGERATTTATAMQSAGSSPRVWGTQWVSIGGDEDDRFIPTCVGNAAIVFLMFIFLPVHPHVCGERCSARRATESPAGSSPRVWGTLLLPFRKLIPMRFIPTCVGNARLKFWRRRDLTVHPHVCGERLYGTSRVEGITGSSPRVWGTQIITTFDNRNGRFIPTCVGNASAKKNGIPMFLVHPHVCGERLIIGIVPIIGGGSSPRVWGTQSAQCRPSTWMRFIPTCVGNAGDVLSPTIPSTVHPHVCGER